MGRVRVWNRRWVSASAGILEDSSTWHFALNSCWCVCVCVCVSALPSGLHAVLAYFSVFVVSVVCFESADLPSTSLDYTDAFIFWFWATLCWALGQGVFRTTFSCKGPGQILQIFGDGRWSEIGADLSVQTWSVMKGAFTRAPCSHVHPFYLQNSKRTDILQSGLL